MARKQSLSTLDTKNSGIKAEAEKKVVAAQAEAEANKLRTQALTPLILKQQWIEKWDGKLPVYGSLPTLFKGTE